MIFDANDPRLTAYALDEVDSAERAEIEQLLADCQEARTHVSEIRQTAQWLTQELQKEQETVSTLGMANHLVIEQALSSPLPTVTSRPWWRKPYRLLATAATLLICGTVGLLTWSAHQMLYYPRVEYSAVKPRQPQAQHSSTIASSDDLGNKDLLARSTTAVESEDTTHNPAEHQDKRLGLDSSQTHLRRVVANDQSRSLAEMQKVQVLSDAAGVPERLVERAAKSKLVASLEQKVADSSTPPQPSSYAMGRSQARNARSGMLGGMAGGMANGSGREALALRASGVSRQMEASNPATANSRGVAGSASLASRPMAAGKPDYGAYYRVAPEGQQIPSYGKKVDSNAMFSKQGVDNAAQNNNGAATVPGSSTPASGPFASQNKANQGQPGENRFPLDEKGKSLQDAQNQTAAGAEASERARSVALAGAGQAAAIKLPALHQPNRVESAQEAAPATPAATAAPASTAAQPPQPAQTVQSAARPGAGR